MLGLHDRVEPNGVIEAGATGDDDGAPSADVAEEPAADAPAADAPAADAPAAEAPAADAPAADAPAGEATS